MDAKETLQLISKQWCDLNDLRKLTGLGKNKATELKKNIKDERINKGYQLPSKLLPMDHKKYSYHTYNVFDNICLTYFLFSL